MLVTKVYKGINHCGFIPTWGPLHVIAKVVVNDVDLIGEGVGDDRPCGGRERAAGEEQVESFNESRDVVDQGDLVAEIE